MQRYVTAIICAIICAGLAFVLFADPVSNWVIAQQKFDSSDDVENQSQVVFMLVNLAGLVVGWTIGWAIGGPIARRAERDGG